jgi:dTDP-4-dehydrorhamnose reductase
MTCLILGGSGQLGLCLQDRMHRLQLDYAAPGRDLLDLSNEAALQQIFRQLKPQAVINAAAYTAVDKAETEAELADEINHALPARLARLCAEHAIPLIHISTDYVFDGQSCRPYLPADDRNPVSVYGKTKAAGELAVLQSGVNGGVIRTSWLYSEYGHNFVKTMLRLGAERSELKVVADQIGTPTYAGDLADAILSMLYSPGERLCNAEIYHFSNQGVASWYDFAWHICRIKGLPVTVLPIRTEDYPTPARRPCYSVLNSADFIQKFSLRNRHWLDALQHCMTKLV